MHDFPTVTVIVPTYNRNHFVERAFVSLVEQDYPSDKLEIIVIDDGSTDQTHEILLRFQSEYPNFRYLQQINSGPATARNAGLREARGEIILFMDDDCIADDKWVRELIRAYEDPEVGGVAGRIQFVPPADNIANRCAARSTGDGQPIDANGQIAFFVTANASFRRAVLEQVGGFDTAFPHAAQEDLDLSFRVKSRGWKLLYSDTAIVHHYHHHTIRGDLKRCFQIGQAEAIMRVKHGVKYTVWAELPLSFIAFWRVPFGCVRNLARGVKPLESLMAPLHHRLRNVMLALGRTKGYFSQRNRLR